MDLKNLNEGFADGEEPLHFYYNREERIARAPKIVQDYYSGKWDCRKKGLFKVMFANRGNRFMFAGIVIFMLFVWIYSFISARTALSMAGTTAEIYAFSYEGTVYSSFKLNGRKKKSAVGLSDPLKMTVLITALDTDSVACNVYEEDVIYDGSELFVRTRFPDYDIMTVVAEVHFGSEHKKFTARVDHR